MEKKIFDLLQNIIKWFRISTSILIVLALILTYITLFNPGISDKPFSELLWRLFFITVGATLALRYVRDRLDKIIMGPKDNF